MQTVIAKRSDMLVMSSDGPLNAYVNTHGFVSETMTFYDASHVVLNGHPIKEHSWFPGYDMNSSLQTSFILSKAMYEFLFLVVFLKNDYLQVYAQVCFFI